ncbi:MAG: ABC1 kinase family protein [Candidatus Dormibacteraceae bacterium]
MSPLFAFPKVVVIVVGAASFAVVIAILAIAARRLLGIRVGAVRALLAGATGLAVWAAFAFATAPAKQYLPLLGPAFGLGVLAAALVLLLAEVLLPSSSGVGPLRLVIEIRDWASRTRRYWQVTRIAVRHGLGPYLRGRGDPDSTMRLARSLRLALQEGGVTFVKLGQLLSTRRDVLPLAFVEELTALQSRVAPASWSEIEQVLDAELVGGVDSVFVTFSREPLAAASIAQVHSARLPSGEAVVVKVQRPGIRPVVKRDVDIVRRLARTLERRTRWGAAFGTVDLAEGFAAAIEEELDFRIEAQNLASAWAARSDASRIRLPKLYAELSTGRVLVMEHLNGTPLGMAGAAIDARHLDRSQLARTLLFTLLRQIMFEGVFHADPHPGNVLLLDDGELALLDFGSVGRIDPGLRDAIQRLLQAIDLGDDQALSDALLEIVNRPEELDEQRLQRDLSRFMARHLIGGTAPSMDMFTDLFRLVSAQGLHIPQEVAAVFRALATLEGTLSRLAPGFNIVAEAKLFARTWVGQRLRPKSLRDTLQNDLSMMGPMVRRWPRRLDRITNALDQGRLSFSMRPFADPRDRRFVVGLLHEVLLTAIAVTTGLMAVILLGSSAGPVLEPGLRLFDLFGYYLLVVSALLMVRVLFLVFRAPRGA